MIKTYCALHVMLLLIYYDVSKMLQGLSNAVATSLLGCVSSRPYIVPVVFKEMSSACFSMDTCNVLIIMKTFVSLFNLLSCSDVYMLLWTSMWIPKAFSALTSFSRSPINMSSSLFSCGELNAAVFLWPSLRPVNSSNTHH